MQQTLFQQPKDFQKDKAHLLEALAQVRHVFDCRGGCRLQGCTQAAQRPPAAPAAAAAASSGGSGVGYLWRLGWLLLLLLLLLLALLRRFSCIWDGSTGRLNC